MELTKIQSGYPCHKYLARNIRSENELWSFAKAFITTVVHQKVDWDNALSMLITALSEMPADNGLTIPDFSHIGLTSKDSCLFIMNNSDTPVFKSCNSFYRKKDSKTPCCRICPISSIYYNKNEDHEYAVMKYMFRGKSEFDFVADYVDAGYFNSALDVTLELRSDKACVVPVLKEVATSALKKNIRMLLFDKGELNFLREEESPFDIAWKDAISRFPRERRIPAAIKNNPMWANVLKKTIQIRLEAAADYNTEQLLDLFADYLNLSMDEPAEKETKWQNIYIAELDTAPLPEKKLPQTTSQPASVDPGISGKENVVSEPSVSQKETLEKIPVADNLADPLQTDNFRSSKKVSYTSDEQAWEESNLKPQDLYPANSGDYQTARTPSPNEEFVPGLFDQPADRHIPAGLLKEQGAKPADASPDKELNTKASANADPAHMKEPSFTSKNTNAHAYAGQKLNSLDSKLNNAATIALNMNRNMIPHIDLDSTAMNEICVPVSDKLPDNVYQGILRDKSMIIEVIRTNSDYYFLIWSRHSKKFFVIPSKSNNVQLFELLSRNMVKKICYTPYLLYGIARLNGAVVKNVASLQTMHTRVTGKLEVMSYEAFIKAYANDHTFSSAHDTFRKCIFFEGMPYYKGISHVLTQMLDKYEKPILYDIDRYVDESIGYSYLYGRMFKDDAFLTQLLPNGHFEFKEEYNHSPKISGYYLSYTIRNASYAYDTFRYIMYALARDGYMRKYDIVVTGLHKNYMTLFISEEVYEYITTLIPIYLYEYSELYPDRKFNVEQLTEYIQVNK